jgi:hypothetical protein
MQNSYYKVLMPSVFQGLQDLDEKKTKYMRNYMTQATEAEKNVYPIVNKCLDGILRAASEINDGLVSFHLSLSLSSASAFLFSLQLPLKYSNRMLSK